MLGLGLGLAVGIGGGRLKPPDYFAPLLASLAVTAALPTATFTRASTGYVQEYDGVLTAVASGEARFLNVRRVSEGSYSAVEDGGPGLSGYRMLPSRLINTSTPAGFHISGGKPSIGTTNPITSVDGTYHVRDGGSDTADGLTESTAVATLAKAYALIAAAVGTAYKIDIGEMDLYGADAYPAGGVFPDGKHIHLSGAGKTLSRVFNAAASVSWSGPTSGVYSATVSDAYGVVDLATLDAYDNPTGMDIKADLSTLQAASDGYFIDGTTVYVKPYSGRTPDSDLLVMIGTTTTITAANNGFVSYENLTHIGWGLYHDQAATPDTAIQTAWTDNCLFGYNADVKSVYLNKNGSTAARLYSNNTDVAYSGDDGYNYNNQVFGVEHNCRGYNPGWFKVTPDTTNQGSTGHNTSSVVSISAEYTGSARNDCADVSGSARWYYRVNADSISSEHGFLDSSTIGATWNTATDHYRTYKTTITTQGGLPSYAAYRPRPLKGLLIEGAVTNLFTQSESYTTQWVASASTQTPASGTAPDGANTATLQAADRTSAAQVRLRDTITASVADNTDFVVSHFYKYQDVQYGYIRVFQKDGTNELTHFDLINGLVATSTNSDAGIEDYGDGWYRCWVMSNSASGGSALNVDIAIVDADGATSYSGVIGEGNLYWGTMAHVGTVPQAYVKSAGSQGAKVADKLALDAGNYTAAGSFACTLDQAGDGVIMQYGSGSNMVQLSIVSGNLTATVVTGGVTQASITGGAVSSGRVGLVWADNDVRLYINGSATGTPDTTATMPTAGNITTLTIGSDATPANHINGAVRGLAGFFESLPQSRMLDVTQEAA